MAEPTKRKTNALWPEIVDLESAKQAAKSGYYVALIVAVMTGGLTTISLFAGVDIASLNAWSYLDTAMFAFIAWRIKRYSKIFAVLGVLLFLAEKALMLPTQGVAGLPLAIVFLLLFVGGARGVFAYHRYSSDSANAVSAPQHA